MGNYNIEIYCGTNVTVSVKGADSVGHAIDMAKEYIKNEVKVVGGEHTDTGDITAEAITFAEREE
jgi:hypothetical protein